MLISFIIPIYKIDSELLHDLLFSLNKQQFRNEFECIFVIDEPESHEKYANVIKNTAKFPNYKYMCNSKNLGSGETRNIGIHNASGRYISFIDADDAIDDDYMKDVRNIIVKNEKIDVFRIGYIDNKYCNEISEFNNIVKLKKTKIPAWAPWTILVKKKFLSNNKIEFLKGSSYGEDIYFFIRIMSLANRWIDINKKLYIYNRGRENSQTTKKQNYFVNLVTVKKIIEQACLTPFSIDKKKTKFFKNYIWKRILKIFLYKTLKIDNSKI